MLSTTDIKVEEFSSLPSGNTRFIDTPDSPYIRACRVLGVHPRRTLLAREGEISTLSYVSFSRDYLGDRGLNSLLEILVRNNALEALDLAGNGLTNDSVLCLAEAMITHPTLQSIELSNNPISHGGATALLSLVRRNPRIKYVRLDKTNVDKCIIQRIESVLARRRLNMSESRNVFGANSEKSDPSPFSKMFNNQVCKAQVERDAMRARRIETNLQRAQRCSDYLMARLRAFPFTQLRLLPASGGWLSLRVFISCAPCGFSTELRYIFNSVFPALNAQLRLRRVVLVPVTHYRSVPPLIFLDPSTSLTRFAVRMDAQRDIVSCCPFFVQLLGEKHGLLEWPTESSEETPHFSLEKEYALGSSMPFSFVFLRQPMRRMHVPPPYRRFFSDNIDEFLGDNYSRTAREQVVAAVEASACGMSMQPPPAGFFDADAARSRWIQHCSFVDSVRTGHPSCLLCEDYECSFDSVTQSGEVTLKGLEQFCKVLQTFLRSAVETLLSVCTPERSELGSVEPTETAVVIAKTPIADELRLAALRRTSMLRRDLNLIPRVSLAGKLRRYVERPPGRCICLLRGPADSSDAVSAVIRTFTCEFAKGGGLGSDDKEGALRDDYIVAYYSCSDAVSVFSSPDDLRTLFCSLAHQLLAADGKAPKVALTSTEGDSETLSGGGSVQPRLPLHAMTSMKLTSSLSFYTQELWRIASSTNKIILVIIDSLDALSAPPPVPSDIRTSNTGANCWTDAPRDDSGGVSSPHCRTFHEDSFGNDGLEMDAGSNSQGAARMTLREQLNSFIPVSLPANVRLVVSCTTGSPVESELAGRGPTSCYVLDYSPLADYEVDRFLRNYVAPSVTSLEPPGSLDLPAAERLLKICANKQDRCVLSYLRILFAFVERYVQAAPGDVSPSLQVLLRLLKDKFPGTLPQLCLYWLSVMEMDLPPLLVRRAIALLGLTRKGLTRDELEEVLLRVLGTKTAKKLGLVSTGEDGNNCSRCMPGYLVARLSHLLDPVLERSAFYSFGAHSVQPIAQNSSEVVMRFAAQSPFFSSVRHLCLCTAALPITERLKGGPPESLSEQDVHRCLASFFLSKFLEAHGPRCGVAASELCFHAVRAHRWTIIEKYVLNLRFAEVCFELGHGYELINSFVDMYNYVFRLGDSSMNEYDGHVENADSLLPHSVENVANDCHASKHVAIVNKDKEKDDLVCVDSTDIGTCKNDLQEKWSDTDALLLNDHNDSLSGNVECGKDENHEMQILVGTHKKVFLEKVKQYAQFFRQYNVNLVQFPQMIHQIAITAPRDSFIYGDAARYFASQQQAVPHFLSSNNSKRQTHKGIITCCQWYPSGLRFSTCGTDKTVNIYSATGEVLYSVRVAPSPVQILAFSASGRYLCAADATGGVTILDTSNAAIISNISPPTSSGGAAPPVHFLALSRTGRFLATASTDRYLHIFESESGALLVSVAHHSFCHAAWAAARSAIEGVFADPFDDNCFFVACGRNVLKWRLKQGNNEASLEALVKAPIGAPIAQIVLASGGSMVITLFDACISHDDDKKEEQHSPQTSVHILSIKSGRDIAFTSPRECSPIYSQAVSGLLPDRMRLSPDECTLAVAFKDGVVGCYHLNWAGLVTHDEGMSAGQLRKECRDGLFELPPVILYVGFMGRPSPRVTHLVFSGDSRQLAAAGDVRHIKLLRVPLTGSHPGVERNTKETQSEESREMRGARTRPKSFPKHLRLLDGGRWSTSTLCEYLVDARIGGMDLTSNPQEGAPGLIVGDGLGRMWMLILDIPPEED